MRILLVALVALGACNSEERDRPRRKRAHRVDTAPAQPAPMPSEPPPECQVGRDACAGDDVVSCLPGGKLGPTVETCEHGCKRGHCVDTCEIDGVELIYVVDSSDQLRSFDPRLLPNDPFKLVGKLGCDPSSDPASMAVDRRGVAWVTYRDGEIYRVSIVDAHCSRYGTAPDPETWGMGYVTDAAGGSSEKLYVVSHGRLAQLDVSQPAARSIPIGSVTGRSVPGDGPELTGTGEGKLFGYFPSPGRGFVQEIDRRTAELVGDRLSLGPDDREVGAFAFAHWGGVFYVFSSTGGGSAVHAVHRDTGAFELVRDDLPFTVVGAGVSTCAPALERR